MKVLHIVSGSLSGGAARGAYWLHQSLLSKGIDSVLLCNDPNPPKSDTIFTTAGTVLGRVETRLHAKIDRLPIILYRNRTKRLFSCGITGFDFLRTKMFNEADILHLHWINMGFVNMRHLKKVEKPIVWTLRDMWPFTGGCHYAQECTGYKTGCGRCPHLGSTSILDLSRLLFERKCTYLPEHLLAVGISRWLTDEAKTSRVFERIRTMTIPNGLNMSDWFPEDKAESRRSLGVPANALIIAAGAQYLTDFYKGGGHLLDTIGRLEKENYHLLVFGRDSDRIADAVKIGCTDIGYLGSAVDLRRVYTAADVFIAPSTMEAFGKTIIESMACETPVVCFNATGPMEIVDHKVNGYKARPLSSQSLAEGIEWVISHNVNGSLGRAGREKVLSCYNIDDVSKKYIDLYHSISI
ncbi:MAG: glycosyltransferase family 4 protein [Bradymonadales bacterium]|nr:glycosyltransferase family 4 protein [Bradymonadales bacterium]